VNGSAYQCAGNCYSPAHYGYADLATGAFRFAIFKKDEHRNLCFRIIMGTMSHAPLHIVTSTPLVVEAAYRTTNAADCDSVLPVAPDGALVPADAMGHVFASRDAKGVCTLDLDVTLYLSGSDPIATETLRSPPIALPDLACQ
jgi:hypothetical protein